MIQTGFKFKCYENQVVDMDWSAVKKSMLSMGEGEMFLRPKRVWDRDRMRNYLHGPVTDFIIDEWAKKNGSMYTRPQMHRFLREAFLPGTPINIGGVYIPDPMSEKNVDKDGYWIWLNKIKNWCMDFFQCDLPVEGQIEKVE